MSINYLCRTISITLHTFGSKETLTLPCHGGKIDHFSARRFCICLHKSRWNLNCEGRAVNNRGRESVRSFMLKWISPQAHKYHILLTFMCRKPDVKYRRTISFIITFCGNNRYGADQRFGLQVWSWSFSTEVLTSGEAKVSQSSFKPQPHAYKWILEQIFISCYRKRTFNDGKSLHVKHFVSRRKYLNIF